MSNRYEYPQISASGVATNDAGSLDLYDPPGATMYLYIERLNFSIYEAAAGGGGIVEIKDTDGNVVHAVNADGVKDVPLNYGDEGLKVGPNRGIQVTVSGAALKQASVAVSFTGHLAFR